MKLDRALDRCLQDIQEHNVTVEDCLARFPQQTEAMEPLLRLAASITGVPPVRPAPEFKRATRRRLLTLSPPAQVPGRRNWVDILTPGMGGWGRRLAVASAGVILILVVLSGGAAVAAADSLPDSPLYPIKRATEQAWLLLTPSDAARARLHIAYAQRRLDEAVIMAQRGEEGRARELLKEYGGELQAAMAIVEEFATRTTKLSAELRGEVVEQSKALESTGQTLSPEVKRLGLAAAREAQVGLSTLTRPSPAELPLGSPIPTETQLIEELGIPTLTVPSTQPLTTGVTETPSGLEGAPTAEVQPTPTTTGGGGAPTATQIPSPAMPVGATPTVTAEVTPEATLLTVATTVPARFTPTSTSTPARATPTPTPRTTVTSSPAPPTTTPTFTPRAYPGPTGTPSPTATPVPPPSTPTPRAYPAPTHTPTPAPTYTPPSALRDTPTPTATPVPPTSTPTSKAYPGPTDTPTPTNVPPSALRDTPTATPAPTDTPPPVPTDTPTAEPYPPPGG